MLRACSRDDRLNTPRSGVAVTDTLMPKAPPPCWIPGHAVVSEMVDEIAERMATPGAALRSTPWRHCEVEDVGP